MNASHGLEINKFALRIVTTIVIVCVAYIAITWQRHQKITPQPVAIASQPASQMPAQPLTTQTLTQTPSQTLTTAQQPTTEQAPTADASALLDESLSNEQFISQALQLTQHKTAAQARAEVALNRYFVSLQQQPQFAALQLELAQCAAHFCVLAVDGFAALTPAQQAAAEQALRFEQALDNTVAGVSSVAGVSRILNTATRQWRAIITLQAAIPSPD